MFSGMLGDTTYTVTSDDGGMTWTIACQTGTALYLDAALYSVDIDHTKVHPVGDSGTSMTTDRSFTFGAIPGDITGDGQVDLGGPDYLAFGASNPNSAGDSNYVPAFDFNADGSVDATDGTVFNAYYGTHFASGYPSVDPTQWTASVYDADGEVTQIASGNLGGNGALNDHYSYDGAGRVTRQTDLQGDVTTYTYDATGQLLTQTLNSVTTTYAYDSTRPF
jgi:hypothetical protein